VQTERRHPRDVSRNFNNRRRPQSAAVGSGRKAISPGRLKAIQNSGALPYSWRLTLRVETAAFICPFDSELRIEAD